MGFPLRFGPLTKYLQGLSEMAVWQVRLSEVRRQVVPDLRSSCTEGSVTEVGPRTTHEKCTSLSRAHLLGRASVMRQQSPARYLGAWIRTMVWFLPVCVCVWYVKGLCMVMDAATQANSLMLEQYVDFLQGTLFIQISQPIDYRVAASIKNHNELLRCFAVIG